MILALWTLFFLAALSLAVGAHVSSSLETARRLRDRTTAYYLARAGVERAVMAIKVEPGVYGRVTNNASVFKDNNSLEGGSFSVRYVAWVAGQGVVTNYGLLCERQKLNVNTAGPKELQKRMGEVCPETGDSGAGLAEAIVAYRKGLTGPGRNGNFEHMDELRMVPGMTPELLTALEPYFTIHGSTCYGATATGTLAGRSNEESRIDFVFDAGSADRFKFWREQ